MRDFFEQIEWQKMQPNSGIVKSGPNTNGRKILASAATDSTFIVAYSPHGMDFSLDLSPMKSGKVAVTWFNPRNNSYINLKEMDRGDNVSFDPPADPERGNDWVLLLQSK